MIEADTGTPGGDMVRMSDCLRAIATGLSEHIASQAALTRLLEISDQLPLTTGGGFECHLHDPNKVDLAARITTKDGERSALAGTHPLFSYPLSLFNYPVWSRIRTFARHWQNTSTLMNHRVRYCWLEFDAHLSHAITLPCVFFDSGEKIWAPQDVPPNPQREIKWIYETATMLAGHTLKSEIATHLKRCYTLLPPRASFGYIGTMLSRNMSGIRLTLPGFAPSQLTPYLQTIGWNGPFMPDIRLLDLRGSRVTLHIDIDQQIGSTLGFEISFADSPHNEPGWRRLLESFIRAGICCPSVLPAILAWPGISDAQTAAQQWSPRLYGCARRIVRRLNHLKLTYNHDGVLSAKAYLYFGLLDDDLT